MEIIEYSSKKVTCVFQRKKMVRKWRMGNKGKANCPKDLGVKSNLGWLVSQILLPSVLWELLLILQVPIYLSVVSPAPFTFPDSGGPDSLLRVTHSLAWAPKAFDTNLCSSMCHIVQQISNRLGPSHFFPLDTFSSILYALIFWISATVLCSRWPFWICYVLGTVGETL